MGVYEGNYYPFPVLAVQGSHQGSAPGSVRPHAVMVTLTVPVLIPGPALKVSGIACTGPGISTGHTKTAQGARCDVQPVDLLLWLFLYDIMHSQVINSC